MDVEAIMDCIGDDLEIGTEPVDPGLSSLGRVQGTATEDNVPGEGIIYYDIRFTAYLESARMHHRHILPDAPKKKKMKILLNIEAQKSTDPGKLGYHLENRIIFYLARMISAQKQTEFFHSDLFSGKSATKKKQILEDEYGMVMSDELEGKIKIMCNLSEAIKDNAFQMGISEGIAEGIAKERISAIKRMIKATISKEQIVSMGYTEAEFAEAESSIRVNL